MSGLHVSNCFPFDDLPPISGDKTILKALSWFHCVVPRRASAQSSDVLCSTISLRKSDDLLYSVCSFDNHVIIDAWIVGLARFVRVNFLLAGGAGCAFVSLVSHRLLSSTLTWAVDIRA